MSQCVFTENILVTIGMFCDDRFRHSYAQFCTNMHKLCKSSACTKGANPLEIISRARFLCRTVEAMMLDLGQILQK